MKFKYCLLSILLIAGIFLFLPLMTVSAAESDDFVITVKTDIGPSSDTQFTIPTTGGGYNYNVDCNNDGIDEATGQTGDYTCNYASAGTYTIRIKDNTGSGTGFPRIYFNNADDAQKLLSIDQWGTGKWTSMANAFYGCENLTSSASDAPDLSSARDLSAMFAYATSFNSDLSHWNVSNINDMSSMFAYASSFNGDLSNWNVFRVNDMSTMFAAATSFNQDLSGWDVSNVVDMGYMFAAATSFDGDLSDWDVYNVNDMSYMFTGVTLSTQNYDALLNGWSNLSLQPLIFFDGGNSKYCQGEAARQLIIDSHHWTIIDGGQDCSTTQPILLSPANKTLVAERTIFFTWEPVPTMTRYILEIKKVSDNSVVYKAFYDASVRCDATTCTVPLPIDLEPGVKYKWHVIPWEVSGTRGVISNWWVFTQKLTTPVLRSPGDGATLTGSRPTFKWYPVYTANEYVIELLDDGGTRVNIWSWKNPVCGTYCEFRVPAGDALVTGDYQWRVRARNDDRASDWSGLYIFTYE